MTSTWEPHPWVTEGSARVRFSVTGGSQSDWPRLVQFVQRVEALDFDAYWLADHPIRAAGCWTTLAGLAVLTHSVRLGVLVSCVLYRSAAEVARMAADVDRMSGGRFILGLGIGIEDQEFKRLGMAMPSVRERLQALEETVVSVRRLWSGEMQPPPLQSPRVPILIAGSGEKHTLRQVAQYADAANLAPPVTMGPTYALSAEDLRRKLSVLEQHCRDVGRPVSSVVVAHSAGPVIVSENPERITEKLNAVPEVTRTRFQNMGIMGTPEEVTQVYQGLVDLGLNYFVAGVIGNDLETLELLGTRVVPNVIPKGLVQSTAVA
ncbi:MAG: LLM class flavin-dependent oxidoreductase [Chloroflexi bacterium]|nr:LLM class flavin-dependent oxidoreductase [Chloroflexota bacterium]MBV9599553.1 LLM class flavin-dependent oxidoreductase [Chloroflexota bacterium]